MEYRKFDYTFEFNEITRSELYSNDESGGGERERMKEKKRERERVMNRRISLQQRCKHRSVLHLFARVVVDRSLVCTVENVATRYYTCFTSLEWKVI